MQKIFTMFLIVLIASCTYLWVKGNTTREIRTEIEIDASPPTVWRILTDFNNWENWNPIVEKVSGEASLGSELSVAMKGSDAKDGPKYKATVEESRELKFFRWRGKMMAGFIMTNDKVFELEEHGMGTRLVHKELFRGMLVPLFWGKFETGVPPMLNMMNEALKKQAEK